MREFKKQTSIPYTTYFHKLKEGVIYPVYFLFGSDHPAKYEFIEELKKTGKYQKTIELSCATSVSNEQVNNFLSNIYTHSLWAERQLLLISDFQNLSLSAQKKLLELTTLLKKNPITTLVIESKYDNNVKNLLDNYSLAVLNFYEPDEVMQIQQILKTAKELGLTIDYDAARLLMEMVGNNYLNIVQELKKIKTYLDKNSKVTSDIVLATCGVSKEGNIDDFLNACFERDLKNTLRNFLRLTSAQVHLAVVISSLARLAFEVLLVKLSHAGELLGLSKKRYNRLLKYAQAWSAKELVDFSYELLKIDRKIKSGYTNSHILLEKLLIRTSKNYKELGAGK
ncbi:MAG: DNA polymerase III subunit delta [candidate division WOR-3 bacterium]|nr:DNA polymerase III subunit delta [candidate division WOR-3 bacterium]